MHLPPGAAIVYWGRLPTSSRICYRNRAAGVPMRARRWTTSGPERHVLRTLRGSGRRAPMTEATGTSPPEQGTGNPRLALLLAMAMFVLVVDTSLMNVSISSVVEDLDATVSGVQSAIALEALVSAAFILIGSKVADLIGRKRAYVLGLLGYAVGALSMAFAQNLLTILLAWAVVGGLGASLLLPSMQ